MSDIGFLASPQKTRLSSQFISAAFTRACSIDAMGETATRLAAAFLQFKNNETRMAELIRRIGDEVIAPAADLETLPRARNSSAFPSHPWLPHAGARAALGLGLPFGRIEADKLRLLADAAAACSGVLRLSPWRVVFLLAEKIDVRLSQTLARGRFHSR